MTMFRRPLRTKSDSNAGSDVKAIVRVSSSHSTSGLPRDIALPMTTRSGASFASRAGSYPSCNVMPAVDNTVLIGG